MSSKLVLVTGNFNVLHPGHMRLLRFARGCGDRLLVGVNSDNIAGKAAFIEENLRLDGVRSNMLVDEAFLVDEKIIDLIARLRPSVIIKGKEHEYAFNEETSALEQYGGRLIFSSGETIFSSADLLSKELFHTKLKSINLPVNYMMRHDIDLSRLNGLLQNFSAKKVCVIGDLIIDEYINCQPLGMSQEDPTIVVTPLSSAHFIGGAGIVAAHAVGMGADVQFISVVGNDVSGDLAKKMLAAEGVTAKLLVDENRPTTLKQRFRSKGKTLLRVSHLHQSAVSIQLQALLLEKIEDAIVGADLLVFSDFNYGCLPQPLVDKITVMAKSRGIVLAADSQSSSQLGDIGRFQGMDLLTPTEHEARLAMRNSEDGLVVLAERLRDQSCAGNVILKMGEEGVLIHQGVGSKDHITDKIGALNSVPQDVAGAGDSLLITSALTLVSGGNIWEAACLGSLSAAVQVGRIGNKPLSTKELVSELET
ncbi:PfkB family carbohydrate kinase [Amylibacter sp.]|nr:PfkB family carbohydrate kinase [Amylibacter sp.]